MNGTGRFRRVMRADVAGDGELLEEAVEAGFVLTHFRIDVGGGAFEVDGAEDAGGSVAGAGEEDNVLIEQFDGAVEVGVDEGEAGGGAPVAEEAVFDVFRFERLFEERIVLKVDHAQGEVVAGGLACGKYVMPRKVWPLGQYLFYMLAAVELFGPMADLILHRLPAKPNICVNRCSAVAQPQPNSTKNAAPRRESRVATNGRKNWIKS